MIFFLNLIIFTQIILLTCLPISLWWIWLSELASLALISHRLRLSQTFQPNSTLTAAKHTLWYMLYNLNAMTSRNADWLHKIASTFDLSSTLWINWHSDKAGCFCFIPVLGRTGTHSSEYSQIPCSCFALDTVWVIHTCYLCFRAFPHKPVQPVVHVGVSLITRKEKWCDKELMFICKINWTPIEKWCVTH